MNAARLWHLAFHFHQYLREKQREGVRKREGRKKGGSKQRDMEEH